MGIFEGSGKNAGLTIWRIESMEAALIDKESYGKFHDGDSYIVLNTITKGSRVDYDIHMWQGRDTSKDEMGTCAYKAVELDGYLGGKPVIHRNVQDHESNEFVALFKTLGGVRYLSGGVESAFKHVKPEEYKPVLLQLKGRRQVRVLQVDVASTSLNEGDVFIYDAGLKLYLWNGKKSSLVERRKGLELVNQIRNERIKRDPIIIRMSEDPGNSEFWGALGPKSAVKSASEGGEDSSFEKRCSPKLYRLSDSDGSLEVSEISTSSKEVGKLTKDLLDSNDVFILDTGTNIFVWVGTNASEDEKKNALLKGMEFLDKSDRPAWTPVKRVFEHGETAAFKSSFSQWNKPILPTKKSNVSVGIAPSPRAQKAVDLKSIMKNKAALEEKNWADDGSGSLTIWRIEDMEKVEIPKEIYGMFYGGDSYIVAYTYLDKNRREKHLVYFWLGSESSTDERGAAALLAVKVKETLSGDPPICRVIQGKEPTHFSMLFKGTMCVHAGGKASGFKSRDDVDSYDVDGISLFRIHGTTSSNTKATQVSEIAGSLNSGDCFILQTPDVLYQWNGLHSNSDEQDAAAKLGKILQGSRSTVTFMECRETDEFWAGIGGKGDYNRSATIHPDVEPRLFQCSNVKSGFNIEEIPAFLQEDLIDDDVMLLDCFSEIYIWIGSKSNMDEQKLAVESAEKFIAENDDGRDSDCPILRVCAAFEPPMFTQHFMNWNNELACSSEEAYHRKLAELGSAFGDTAVKKIQSSDIGYSTNKVYSYEVLISTTNRPKDIDPSKKENYLSNEEFNRLFGMDRIAFNGLAMWKQKQKKQLLKLF